jgi:hypothetical protein
MAPKKVKKPIEFTLPKDLDMIGVFKLKDKEGRRAVRLVLKEPITAVIIQKVAGESNKIVVAVQKGEIKKSPIYIMGENDKK